MPESRSHAAFTRRLTLAVVAVLATATVTTSAADAHPSNAMTGPLCGAAFAAELPGETYQQALRREDGYYNGLDSVRVFYPGLPQPWPGKLDTNRRPIVVSFKARPASILTGTHDARLREWFQQAPRDRDTYWTYFHEPENDIDAGAFTAEQFRLAWQRIAGLADKAANPGLRATLILMGWSVDPASGRNWHDYHPGNEYIHVLGWDLYNPGWPQGRYKDPTELLSHVIAASNNTQLPFGIAEIGSPLITGDNGTARAAWLRQLVTVLTDAGAEFIEYFDHDMSNSGAPDYRLRDTPSITAWQEFCSGAARRESSLLTRLSRNTEALNVQKLRPTDRMSVEYVNREPTSLDRSWVQTLAIMLDRTSAQPLEPRRLRS